MALPALMDSLMRGLACRMALMRHSTASPTSTAPCRPKISAYTMLSLRRHRSTPEDPLTNLRLHPMGASLFRPSITAKPSPVSRTCTRLTCVIQRMQANCRQQAVRHPCSVFCLEHCQTNQTPAGEAEADAHLAKVDLLYNFAHSLELIGLLQTLAKQTHLLFPISLLKRTGCASDLASLARPSILASPAVLGDQHSAAAAKLMCMRIAQEELAQCRCMHLCMRHLHHSRFLGLYDHYNSCCT